VKDDDADLFPLWIFSFFSCVRVALPCVGTKANKGEKKSVAYDSKEAIALGFILSEPPGDVALRLL